MLRAVRSDVSLTRGFQIEFAKCQKGSIGKFLAFCHDTVVFDDSGGPSLQMSMADALVVSAAVSIPRSELTFRASRAGGAGGQHVNTSSTRIELLWNVRTSSALDDEARARVEQKLASRLDSEGFIRVVSSARRSQGQNRAAAEERLAELVRVALVVPRKRRATKPTRASKEARLTEKRIQSERKRRRGSGFDD